MKRRNDLTAPRQRRRIGIHYDPDAFGQFSEAIARFLGTGRYLIFQTVIVVSWVLVNAIKQLQFDGYPFIFLTLILSLQASYAAPLILLAQNRQEDRDREQTSVTVRWQRARRPTPSTSPASLPVFALRWPMS